MFFVRISPHHLAGTQIYQRRAVLKSLFAGVVSCALAFSVVGCSQQEGDAAENSASATPSTAAPENAGSGGDSFKIALVTVSPVSDKGWSASANEGVEKIKSELGATSAPPVENPAAAEREGTFRNLAQDGATIVFGNGSEYDSVVKNVATEFPKTTFSIIGGRSTAANLIPIAFQADQASYLAGMLAASVSKTGKIGLVGGDEIPIIKAGFAAFGRGAKSVKPTIQVKTTFTGDGTDTAKAKAQAQALIDDGCDVLSHNANAAGLGVFQAVSEKPGVSVIGANADQSDQATTQNLGSFILEVPNAMLGVAKLVTDGKASAKVYQAGLKDKAVGFKFNAAYKGTIPADIKAKMAKAEADMIAGTLDPTK